MRFVPLIAALISFALSPASATLIQVAYQGTYTGGWGGNYPPGEPGYGDGGGSLGSGFFTLTFNFDTTLADPDHFTRTSLSNFAIDGYSTPSVGSGSISLGISAGSYYASNTASAGSTSQIVSDFYFGRGVAFPTPVISMTATDSRIPADILTPITLYKASGLATGYATYSYATTGYGGGTVEYNLKANSLKVTVDGVSAVPEQSTWAMILLGFCSVGFITYHRKSPCGRTRRSH
jgi:hypothetical protein